MFTAVIARDTSKLIPDRNHLNVRFVADNLCSQQILILQLIVVKFKALNGLLSADVPLRNYHPLNTFASC